MIRHTNIVYNFFFVSLSQTERVVAVMHAPQVHILRWHQFVYAINEHSSSSFFFLFRTSNREIKILLLRFSRSSTSCIRPNAKCFVVRTEMRLFLRQQNVAGRRRKCMYNTRNDNQNLMQDDTRCVGETATTTTTTDSNIFFALIFFHSSSQSHTVSRCLSLLRRNCQTVIAPEKKKSDPIAVARISSCH